MVDSAKRTVRYCVVGLVIFMPMAPKAFGLEISSTSTLPPIEAQSAFELVPSSRTGQLSGAQASFGQINVFASYPTCSPVRLMSMQGWRAVSFERLSIRVPNSFQVQRDYASDHGGRGWRARNIAVAIDRVYGPHIEPYRHTASLAYRECTTTLGSLFALVQEYGVNGGYSTSVIFPEVGLILHISTPRAEGLALSRTIVSTARATTPPGTVVQHLNRQND
jgi:hypothetical protein